jgi:protein phosphatase
MGVSLPKPVMTKIFERHGNEIFRVGSACVNGYRENMEDAHIVFLRPTWGFFGVFDGHVNDQCSEYLEHAWRLVLEKNPVPMSDERMREIALKIDQEWLDTGKDGGSTGTFFLATREGSTVRLQVGNVGDSRVLVCKNGSCVAMTEDHKPMNDIERRRIEQCGGRVENNRVDGSLAVSRAFGDRDYKANKADQLSQKVIALADVTHIDLRFGAGDYAVLCCDGVFESNFSNEEVIAFVNNELKTNKDLAVVAGKVCDEAISRGSRDNISCVIVEMRSGADYANVQHTEVVPGPFAAPRHNVFRRVYAMMAGKGKTTVQALLEKRYDTLVLLTKTPEIVEELEHFKTGPPATLVGADRTAWFASWFDELSGERMESSSDQRQRIQFLQQQVGVPLPVLLSLMNEQGDNSDNGEW